MIYLYPQAQPGSELTHHDYRDEAEAASELGLAVLHVNTHALHSHHRADLFSFGLLSGKGAVYRGPALSDAQYLFFEAALEEQGAVLRTPSSQYRRAHRYVLTLDELCDPTVKPAGTAATELAYPSQTVRTWWVRGQLRLASPLGPGLMFGDTVLDAQWVPAQLSQTLSKRAHPFFTADFDCRSDGSIRTVSVRDGQVTERPSCVDPALFAERVLAAKKV